MHHPIVCAFRRRLHALLVRKDEFKFPTANRMQPTTFTMSNGWPTSTYVEKRPCEHAPLLDQGKLTWQIPPKVPAVRSLAVFDIFVLFARRRVGSKERAGWNVLRLRRAAFLPLQNPENWNVDRDLHKCVQIINDKITY